MYMTLHIHALYIAYLMYLYIFKCYNEQEDDKEKLVFVCVHFVVPSPTVHVKSEFCIFRL